MTVLLWSNEVYNAKNLIPFEYENFKVVVVVGTRPEIIRLSRVISCLDKNVTHKLIHTGQNFDFELNKTFECLSLRKPDYELNSKSKTSIELFLKFYTKRKFY